MLLLPLNREQLLQVLPPDGIAAEIGVHRGEFSRAIMHNAAPRRLHLIDPWTTPADDREPDNLTPAQQAEKIFRMVERHFAPELQNGRVTIHRETSRQAARHFNAGYFDWIYIDGAHAYESVSADLQMYARRVKSGGFLLGHDYSNSPQALQSGIGVVKAVDDFVKKTGWHFLGLTLEPWPTYILCQDFNAAAAKNLYHKLILQVPNIVELREYPRGNFIHYNFNYENRQVRTLPSF